MTVTVYATYIHRGGCGGPAFLYKRDQAVAGTRITAEHMRWMDGAETFDGEEIQCWTCRRTVWPLTVNNFEEASWL